MENAPVNSAEPVSSNEALGLPPVGASPETTIPQSEDADKPKYSLDAGDDESIFRRTWNKFAKALHLNGDKIVTQESQRREKLLEQERAMADYLKEPTKENRQQLPKLGVTRAQLDAYQNGEEYATEIGKLTDAEIAQIKADNPNDTTAAIQRAKIAKVCDGAKQIVKGAEKDMNWVLWHHYGSSVRRAGDRIQAQGNQFVRADIRRVRYGVPVAKDETIKKFSNLFK